MKPKGGKLLATERDLRPVYKLGTMTGLDGSNVDISQDVNWTAKFVDRISEVTDSMNVSGTFSWYLQIPVGYSKLLQVPSKSNVTRLVVAEAHPRPSSTRTNLRRATSTISFKSRSPTKSLSLLMSSSLVLSTESPIPNSLVSTETRSSQVSSRGASSLHLCPSNSRTARRQRIFAES